MTVKMKLVAAFGALAFAVLIIGLFCLLALSDANGRFVSYIEGINARAVLGDEVRTAVDRRAVAARNMVLVKTPAEVESENAAVLRAHADVQARLARLTEMVTGGLETSRKAQDLVADLARVESAYGPVALDIARLAREGRAPEATEKIITECRPLLARLITAAEAYRDYTAVRAGEMVKEAERRYETQRVVLLVIFLLSVGAAVVAGALITRSLTLALGAEPFDLGAAARRIAEGNLRPVVGLQPPAPQSVMASLVTMQQSLATIVGDVRRASDSIATGSNEIANGNEDLSQRTEEQASALQQTAATMEELGTTVRNNAASSAEASNLASNAVAVASKGGTVVGQVVRTMQGINESSRKITEIVGVIDSIAFQTNILALNAAVEAARAGEQGRGFAVVASEVRNLASRSADAAKEIKKLIVDSVSQVEKGSALVDDAGRTMDEIVHAIQVVSRLVEEISAASREQSDGITQAGDAIMQMDQVTQQNAALVEESAAAADSLRQQAHHLVTAVGTFQLGEETAAIHTRRLAHS
ncbi:methyl-accepting chemotaxis protein [Xylophilus sp. Kf1]|nr:methyl-accepting chemotaxis protein [Xylophilus sp. Kf1]